MWSLLLASLLVTQPPELSSADVGQIVTLLVTDSTHPRRSVMHAAKGRPLLVDVAGSSAAFERFAGRALPVETSVWLPNVTYANRSATEALACQRHTDPPAETCLVRDDAVWVQITDVVGSENPGDIRLRVHVYWTERTPVGKNRMSGFVRTVILRKEGAAWRVARELPTAVG